MNEIFDEQEDLDPYYPEWFTEKLVWDGYPWEDGVNSSMANFLSLYTLHDSSWIALKLDVQQKGYAIAAIRFDALWSDGRIPHPGSLVAEWPIVLLRLHGTTSVKLVDYDKYEEWPRSISNAESVEVEGGVLTRIEDVYGGRVDIEHAGPVDILCVARDGSIYGLDDLRST